MAKTNAQKQRAMRQEELREYLSKQRLVQEVVKSIKEIRELDTSDEYFDKELKKRQVYNDQTMALVRKYMPDLHHSAIEGDSEDGSITINLVSYADKPAE